jgi:uncharacterized protein (TIGR02996 family)
MAPSRIQPNRRVSRELAARPPARSAATPGAGTPGAAAPDELAPLVDRPPPAAGAHIDALIREIHARPDADDARLVLADALLAEGDPRGELIALQLSITAAARSLDRPLAGPLDRPVEPPLAGPLAGSLARPVDRLLDRSLDRADQLLREHGKRWLGSVREVTYRARFARGFLARLELNGRWTATEEGWARHVLDPTLATVEDLIPGRAVGPIYARFVTSPAMRGLRRIEVFDKPTLEALRTTSADLVHVACPRWKVGKYVRELASHVLPACARFAALRSFSVYIDGAASVIASPWFERLTSLTVAGGLAAGLALWPRLPRTMALTVTRSAMLEDCATTHVAWTGALELHHDGDRVVARGAGHWLVGELLEHLGALPPGLRRLEIEDAGHHAPALAAAAQRRHFELVLLPPARRTGYLAGLGR